MVSMIDRAHKIAQELGLPTNEMCNDLFGQAKGRRKIKKHDFCRLCKMALPRKDEHIDYEAQMMHIGQYHNRIQIAKFLAPTQKTTTQYNEDLHKELTRIFGHVKNEKETTERITYVSEVLTSELSPQELHRVISNLTLWEEN